MIDSTTPPINFTSSLPFIFFLNNSLHSFGSDDDDDEETPPDFAIFFFFFFFSSFSSSSFPVVVVVVVKFRIASGVANNIANVGTLPFNFFVALSTTSSIAFRIIFASSFSPPPFSPLFKNVVVIAVAN